MFKRRDWAHMHGQDGEGSSDDDSSEDSGSARHSPSSSEADDGSDSSQAHTSAESDGPESDGDEETPFLSGAKRLQDLSEDDYEEPAEPRIDVDELVQNWLTAPTSQQIKGPPLRCRWCPGTLLLNATALKNHMESKRHQKRQKISEAEPKPICLAEDVLEDESEGETHAERLERLRQLSAPPELSNVSDSKRRRLIRKLKAEQRSKAAKQRPGKRQRAELKAQIFQTTGDLPKNTTTKPGTKKQKQDTRGKQNKQIKQGKKPKAVSNKKQRKA
ncbi:TPA: hypothetical protein ACH3X2_010278 [Trebouxia sp. C0005]